MVAPKDHQDLNFLGNDTSSRAFREGDTIPESTERKGQELRALRIGFGGCWTSAHYRNRHARLSSVDDCCKKSNKCMEVLVFAGA